MSGDGTSNANTGAWNPLEVIEKTETPVLSESNGTITWTEDAFAICYVVTVNGKAVAFPTEPTYEAQQGDIVSVQSVNEYGSLSAPSTPLTVGVTTMEETTEDNTVAPVSKILRNGQLIILKDGKEYSVLGTRVF